MIKEINHDKACEVVKRGTYLITPLKYDLLKGQFQNVSFEGYVECEFKSDDFSALLVTKCTKNSGYVRRFQAKELGGNLVMENGTQIAIAEKQLFIFDNEIAFFTMLLTYEEEQTQEVYQLITPGYTEIRTKILKEKILEEVQALKLRHDNGLENAFILYVDDEELLVKECYTFKAAVVKERFHELEEIEELALNVHKIIPLSKKFNDLSESDIKYTYGARDVEKCTYRWGSCISSQSISYVYADSNPEDSEESIIIRNSKEDLLLTMLVMHQKYTCMLLNDKIYQSMVSRKEKNRRKEISKLKREALEFRALGTLAPSQVSRWNNVCDTYRYLIDVNGIDEALVEIEQKIDLLKSESDEIEAEAELKTQRMQGYIATVIAVFGLVSIIASILTIVDILEGGSEYAVITLGISSVVVAIFMIFLAVMKCRKK